VTVNAIATTVQAAIGGTVQGKYTNKDRRYDVRLRLEGEQRLNPQDILNLDVRTDYGELIPISSVIRTETDNTYQTIARTLRERSISIYANIAPGRSQAAALDRAESIAKEILPPNYRVFSRRRCADFSAKRSRASSSPCGSASSFRTWCWRRNSTASFIPLRFCFRCRSASAARFFALLLTGQSINLYSLIGLVLLMGIVKKNSILLVEFANAKRFVDGFSVRDAILFAGPVRLRPILMTSLATLAAAVTPCPGAWPRSGEPHPDGDHRNRRRDRLDLFHATGRALRV